MSMHMIKGIYAPSSKKRKAKKLDMAKMEIEWRRYNKEMRRDNLHKLQFASVDEYVLYRSGKLKPKKKDFVPYAPKETYRQQTKDYASLSEETIPDVCAKKERPVYTGSYIIGVATMHKSNAVPVGRGDDPKHYAQMRR